MGFQRVQLSALSQQLEVLIEYPHLANLNTGPIEKQNIIFVIRGVLHLLLKHLKCFIENLLINRLTFKRVQTFSPQFNINSSGARYK